MSFLKRFFRRGLNARYREGMDAYNAGRWEEALAAFRRTLLAGGSSHDPLLDLARFYAAEASCQLARGALDTGEPRRALRWLEPASEWNPRDPNVLFLAALALAEVGDFEQAAGRVDALLNDNPHHVHAHLLAAAVEFARGRRGEALLHIAHSQEGAPGEPLSPRAARVVAALAVGLSELEALLRDYVTKTSTRRA